MAAAVNFVFSKDDHFCEVMQEAKLFIAMNKPAIGCQIIYNFDRQERDGYVANAINSQGGCDSFLVAQVLVPTNNVGNTSLVSPDYDQMQKQRDQALNLGFVGEMKK
jgi:hypothetical protein